MHNRLAACRKAAGTIRHHTAPLGRTDRDAKVRFAAEAVFALPAFRCVQRNDVVALLQRRDTRANVHDNPGTLMSENSWENSFRVGT